MEIAHALESSNKRSSSIVDRSQWENHTLGEGYQAKHVVRQRQVQSDKLKKETEHSAERYEPHNIIDNEFQSHPDCKPQRNPHERSKRTSWYLDCRGMRELRKELDSILG